jgi:glyoxylase I family protein
MTAGAPSPMTSNPASEELMERVTGIGGMFFRARDPDALARWYAEHLGIDNQLEGSYTLWWQERGPTVFAPFPADTDYFGRPEQAWMLNLRVRDLDAMVAQLRAAGVAIDSQETQEGVGRFAWLVDPEGNRVELWEPTPDALEPADGVADPQPNATG